MLRDPRASLLVSEPGQQGDPQAGWRVTMIGTMRKLTEDGSQSLDDVHARYLERVPQAEGYRATHDFDYWVLEPVKARVIAGFGRIQWVPAKQLVRDPHAAVVGVAAGAIEHMNADHESSMIELCTRLRGFTPSRATMVGLESTGILVRADHPGVEATETHAARPAGPRLAWFSFGREIEAADVRAAVVGLLRAARGAQPGPPH